MLSSVFIARPRLSIVISIVITIAGLVALTQIPIAQFPDIVPPQIAVTASYAGAGAEVVEQTVAQPIELRVIGVDNMLYMKSTSGNDGSYNLAITFKVGTDPDLNTVKVQNRVSLAEAQLPQEVRSQGVSVTKKSSALLQIVTLTSPDGRYDQLFLSNYATINMIDAFKRIPGIGDASLLTPADYSMKVWLDSNRLTSFGLTPNDIASAIKRQNTQAAVGRIGAQPALPDQQFQLTIQTKGRLSSVEEFESIVVRANPDGSFVRVRDVARVELAARLSELLGRLDGRPAAVIGLYQSPGGNAIDSAERTRKLLEQLKASFPEGVDYKITYDTTEFVKESIKGVVHTLFEGFVLVVIVVFLFLGSFRATLIPLIAVPVSLIGTFSVMLAFGFSANTVSLLALVLAIGIVVDDAIVVVEAVEAHLEKDPTLSPAEAARRAMEEITAPIIAITLVLLSVFVPVAFIPGISGDSVQAVRRRRVGRDDHFGDQRTHAVAGSLRGLPVGETWPETRPDALRAAGDRYHARRLCRRRAQDHAFRDVRAHRAGRRDGRRGLVVQGGADRISALRGSGRGVRRGAIVRGRVGQSHRRGHQAHRGNRAQHAGRRARHVHHRLQHDRRADQVEQCRAGDDAQAVRRTQGRGAFGEWNHRAAAARVSRHPGGGRLRLQSAADHRPRHRQRFRIPAAQSGWRLAGRSCGGRARAGVRGKPGSHARARIHHLQREHAATLPRHRPREAADARGRLVRRLQRAAIRARQFLRQRLQPVRPNLAGADPGRGFRPRQGRRYLSHQRAQQQQRHGIGPRLCERSPDPRTAIDHSLQQFPQRHAERRSRTRPLVGRGDRRDGERYQPRPCRTATVTSGPERRCRRRRRPARPR